MKFIVDHEKLKKHYGRICPCILPNRETAIQDNICPCKKFICDGECRCMLFVEVKE